MNILDPLLRPRVSSNMLCTNNFEVTNLVSSDSSKSKKGFMSYGGCAMTFPVDIYFDFLCEFDVHYITIWPEVGLQKSLGFDILTDNSGTLITVAKGKLDDEPGMVIYRSDLYFERPPASEHAPQIFRKVEFNKIPNIFNLCKKVVVRITSTEGNSIPCISKIQIWGGVSDACSTEIRNHIIDVWKMKDDVGGPLKLNCDIIYKNSQPEVKDEVSTDNKFEVPSQFLDATNSKIMRMPLIMPSGKIIDKTTLDKHLRQELQLGRSLSDPITKIAFTEMHKPMISLPLLKQINNFLLLNKSLPKMCNLSDDSFCEHISNWNVDRSSECSMAITIKKNNQPIAKSKSESELINKICDQLSDSGTNLEKNIRLNDSQCHIKEDIQSLLHKQSLPSSSDSSQLVTAEDVAISTPSDGIEPAENNSITSNNTNISSNKKQQNDNTGVETRITRKRVLSKSRSNKTTYRNKSTAKAVGKNLVTRRKNNTPSQSRVIRAAVSKSVDKTVSTKRFKKHVGNNKATLLRAMMGLPMPHGWTKETEKCPLVLQALARREERMGLHKRTQSSSKNARVLKRNKRFKSKSKEEDKKNTNINEKIDGGPSTSGKKTNENEFSDRKASTPTNTSTESSSDESTSDSESTSDASTTDRNWSTRAIATESENSLGDFTSTSPVFSVFEGRRVSRLCRKSCGRITKSNSI